MTDLDRRLNVYRPDLADADLRGLIEAERFVEGQPAVVVAPVADLLRRPEPDAGLDTQLLAGQMVRVFDRAGGFAWVQADSDGYVGYLAETSLADVGAPATHVVAVPRSFIYAGPDLKLPRRAAHSLGARFAVNGRAETRGTIYALLDKGEAMIAAHLLPVETIAGDFVAVAETLVGTPYLWGGVSAFGIDCSGLVQLSMRMAGRQVLRDTDMQAQFIGTEIALAPDLSGLSRGDLVFWKGHVGIMLDAERLLHANGHTMLVSIEPLREAVDRIGYLYGGPIGVRRP